MPTSKKQIVKLDQVKKAKAEEFSKQAAAGSQEEVQEAREKAQVSHREFPTIFMFFFLGLMGPKRAMQVATCSYLEGSGLHKGFVLLNMNP